MPANHQLTAEEERLVAEVEAKGRLITEKTKLVIHGHSNGFYVWGEPGTGKSYRTISCLEGEKVPYIFHNTRISGPALAVSLQQNSTAIHLVEDCESLFKDKNAYELLRSALWGQTDASGEQRRWVKYEIHGCSLCFEFFGGIIFTGNRALQDMPEMRALRSRIPAFRFVLTRPQMLALMKKLSLDGFSTAKGKLTAAKCLEIYHFHVANLPPDRLLNLRLLINSFRDRIGLYKLGLEASWPDHVLLAIHESTDYPSTRTEIQRREEEIALELSQQDLTTEERLRAWTARTGRTCIRSYYRALERWRRS
jgi:hypothetical protein